MSYFSAIFVVRLIVNIASNASLRTFYFLTILIYYFNHYGRYKKWSNPKTELP